MTRIIMLCLLSLSLQAQTRDEKPLPKFREEPLNILSDSIIGHSYSIDGQWIGKENVIPLIAISTQESVYKSKEAKVGLDNIDALYLIPTQYGKDTLITLVKLYTHGVYKYPLTKKGWEEYTNAYYFIFRKHHLKSIVQFSDSLTKNVRIPLLDGGLLTDIKPKHLSDILNQYVVIKRRYDRDLVLTMQKPKGSEVYFQLYSMHEIFSDVEGIYRNLTRKGTTLYNSTQLLNYIYFSIDQKKFNKFFTLQGASLFELEEKE